jgi:uncharacterized membrane protein required for colicin V production
MAVPVGAGIIIDIIIALVLIFSFIGGLRGGAVKEFLGLVGFIIALPLTGMFAGFVSGWFYFINDANWRSFIVFLVAMGIIVLILHIVFWIPRNLMEKIWNGGFFWSLLGGIFSTMNSALGLVLLVILMDSYPILGSFESLLNASHLLNWLVGTFGAFIMSLMHVVSYTLPVASISSCAA